MTRLSKGESIAPEKTVCVSAPGKVHLMGEHAVVYGKPAFFSAINLRLTAEVSVISGKGNRIIIDAPEDKSHVRRIFDLVCLEYQIKLAFPVRIRIKSDIPVGYHLGSSAALAAAVVGASSFALKKVWNPSIINNLAHEAEKVKHGNPSGGDNTAVVYGGFLWFRKELDFLRTLWQLPINLDNHIVGSFILIDTGRPEESTGEMVALVSSKVKGHPAPSHSAGLRGLRSSKFQKIFDENERATRLMAASLKENSPAGVLEAMRAGERTLEKMGVVSNLARKIIRQVELAGGAAKILGGGGKKKGVGYLLAYHPKIDHLTDFLHSRNYQFHKIKLGGEGIRLEKKGNN